MTSPFHSVQKWLSDSILAKIPSKIDKEALINVAFISAGVTLTLTGITYYRFHKSVQDAEELKVKLDQAENTITDLKQQLLVTESNDLSTKGNKKEVRIFLDGVFDMMHYGHMNAFRQARSLGTYLIAGVCDEKDTTISKGSPVCNEQERIDTVRGCKWVDEVIPNVPYNIPDGFYASLIEKYKIDYIVHGDDPCIINGKNLYESAIQLGKYLTIPRTEGISTTELVGRMLSVDPETNEVDQNNPMIERESTYLTTARVIRLFGAGVKPPKAGDRVVYIAGTWDVFHAAHIEALEKAKKLGDYLIVGVYNDHVSNQVDGSRFPVLSMLERVLSVLGCKYVDDVLFNASYHITQEMISSLNIQVVAAVVDENGNYTEVIKNWEDPLKVAQAHGIVKKISVNHKITVKDFVRRIQSQKDRFASRFAKKMEKEKEFYNTKYHLEGGEAPKTN